MYSNSSLHVDAIESWWRIESLPKYSHHINYSSRMELIDDNAILIKFNFCLLMPREFQKTLTFGVLRCSRRTRLTTAQDQHFLLRLLSPQTNLLLQLSLPIALAGVHVRHKNKSLVRVCLESARIVCPDDMLRWMEGRTIVG